MSVHYSTRLGYGFIIDSNMYNELENRSSTLFEEFMNSDYLVTVDGYGRAPCYFFGMSEFSLCPGEAVMVPTQRHYNHDSFMEMMDEYKTIFPNQDNYIPHDYILCCID